MRPPFDALDKGAKRIAKGPGGSELVPADMTYYEWLKTQPAAFQNDAIGPRRAELLRNGGLSAKRFSELNLGRNFQPLTLEEMKRREPGAFERAAEMTAKNGAASGGGMSDKKDLHFGGESGILDKEGVSVFKRIEGEHSVQQDLAAVNSGYPRPGHTENCGNCAVAYAMRRQGFDVEAKSGEDGMSFEKMTSMFEGVSIQHPNILTTNEQAHEVISKVERTVLAWGEGANGAIRGQWIYAPDDAGHLFSVEVRGGKVIFVDGQSGEADVKHYLNDMTPASIIFGRLDNLRPTDNVRNAVKRRGA